MSFSVVWVPAGDRSQPTGRTRALEVKGEKEVCGAPRLAHWKKLRFWNGDDQFQPTGAISWKMKPCMRAV
jgi:hypothetical protein